MAALVFLAFASIMLLVVGGALSLMHAIIKPVVDWLHPEPPATVPEIDELLKEIERIQKRIRKREEKRLAPKQRERRAKPDGMRAVLRLLEEQKAKDAAKPPPLP